MVHLFFSIEDSINLCNCSISSDSLALPAVVVEVLLPVSVTGSCH